MEAVVSAIRAIDGTGDYTFDLSGPDQVQEGRVSVPPTVPPFASVFEDGEGVFQVIAWAVCDDTDESRTDASNNLMDDVLLAMEASPDPRSTAYATVDSPGGFLPYDDGGPIGYPQVVIAVICYLEDHSS